MKNLFLVFQVAAVFIGTIVGAGLASGQEVSQFFTVHGYKSFAGILICCFIYIIMSYIVIDLSLKHSLKSYDGLISLVSPGLLGSFTNLFTTIFLISTSAIILAGSGALFHQYFNISKWFGIIIMILVSIFILFRGTKGLIEINSFIVPSLIFVIVTIFILYLSLYKDMNISYLKSIHTYKNNWLISSFIYGGFNILCCCGVLVPLSVELKNRKVLICGITLGSIGLTVLSCLINTLLILNVPYIFKYEIPLLYIANRFGNVIQFMLLCIIWLEMFSTEVSNVYSVSKNLQELFNISYKKAVILIIIISIPISQIGFVRLISTLYPAFAVISFIFILQCLFFYFKNKFKPIR